MMDGHLDSIGDWMTLEAAAKRCHLRPDSMYQYARRHHIPMTRLGNRLLLIRWADVVAERTRGLPIN